jgi:transposase
VDAELGQTQQPAQSRETVQRGAFTPRQPQGSRQQDRAPDGQQRKASNKQVKFITDLAGEQKVTLQDLNAEIQERYGVQGLYDLSAHQASEMIESMTGGRNRRRAA